MNEMKEKQLRQHKLFATGLFLLMALGFVVTTLVQKNNPSLWLGYLRAFTEAAMVGALADWFAVTALFHHPFGLKIPHTNLIENSKEKIGDNLGAFVVDNFLSPQNIRPYIQKIKVSQAIGEWLNSSGNREKLLTETSKVAIDILDNFDDDDVVGFLSSKASEVLDQINLNHILSQGIYYVLEHNEHQKVITQLSYHIKVYISNNRSVIREKVSQNSYSFIPQFLDDKIADKIALGLVDYFDEVEHSYQHPLRSEISQHLYHFADQVKHDEVWKEKINRLKENFITEEQLNTYAKDIWLSLKKSLYQELTTDGGSIRKYIEGQLQILSNQLISDEALQQKTDRMVRSIAYKYLLRNTKNFGNLISETVGNWKGKELSQKLELEVGKDLQFIRINGTLVGGLVGLVIYSVAQWLSSFM